ncbi:hypothetical protein BDR05DRAFT_947759 [Suillus weaverae]|nr:hypothetical protein BDR05DRAFT_947759 [Suillus weaverae]
MSWAVKLRVVGDRRKEAVVRIGRRGPDIGDMLIRGLSFEVEDGRSPRESASVFRVSASMGQPGSGRARLGSVLVQVPSEVVVQNDRPRDSNVRCVFVTKRLTVVGVRSIVREDVGNRVVIMGYKSGVGIDKQAFTVEVQQRRWMLFPSIQLNAIDVESDMAANDRLRRSGGGIVINI